MFVESLQPPKIKTTKDFLCLLSKCFKLANLLLLIFAVTKVCFLLALFFSPFSVIFRQKSCFLNFLHVWWGMVAKKKKHRDRESLALFFPPFSIIFRQKSCFLNFLHVWCGMVAKKKKHRETQRTFI